MKLLLTFSCLTLLLAPWAHSSELTPQARLRKLSLHLRGLLPETAEYAALNSAISLNRQNQFFDDKADEYLQTPQHVAKMQTRLQELFWIKPDLFLGETDPNRNSVFWGSPTINLLFRRVAEDNLSWDTLLTAKSYQAPIAATASRHSERAFYEPASSTLISSGHAHGGPARLLQSSRLPDVQTALGPERRLPLPEQDRTGLESIDFERDDPRIAGAITTQRFIDRYPTTALNKNRTRAAAVFRVFLCDDMKAVVTPSESETRSLIADFFSSISGGSAPNQAGNPVHATAEMERRHGTDPACMACHYKLDPLGRTFMGTGDTLALFASPGALVFRRANGTLVEEPARGIGDIARAITRQPEYLQCQVTHFWNWFIGTDVPLTENKRDELAALFDRSGRKPNALIKALTAAPEFYRIGTIDDRLSRAMLYTPVRAMLQRCDSCHLGMGRLPSFSRFPIGGDASTHRSWIQKIGASLDLQNQGRSRRMPPRGFSWQPNAQELGSMSSWIDAGAPNAEGTRTLFDTSGAVR